MRDTIEALATILEKEKNISREKVLKSAYKVSIEFMSKSKDVEARKAYLRRVIEESLDYFPSKQIHLAS